MTSLTRFLRALVVVLVTAGAALPGATPVLANGLGDLYVAVDQRVDEVFLAGEEVVNKVDLDAGAARLAFTPDGSSLFVADTLGGLSRIDIETISLVQSYRLDGSVEAIAHPKGTSLFIASAGAARLAVLPNGDDTATEGPALHGEATLLAADRHELRLVAARAGESWLDVVEPASARVVQANVDGSVVAIAIARDEGFAYVATTSPNQLARVSLDTGKVSWRVALTGKPAAVTAVPEAAIVAVGATLVRVAGGKAADWASIAGGPVTGLVTSDEGSFVYAATSTGITAVNVTQPRAEPAATVALADAVWLAPVPKASSLIPNGGETTGNVGPGPSGGPGDHPAAPSRAPATDTASGGPRWRPAGVDPLLLLGGAAAIVLVTLGVSHVALRRTVGER